MTGTRGAAGLGVHVPGAGASSSPCGREASAPADVRRRSRSWRAAPAGRDSRRTPGSMLRHVPERLAIAQVTPYAWETRHEVNRAVARCAQELAARGHRVLVIAPTHSSALVRETRKAIHAARERPEALLDGTEDGRYRVLGVGEVLPFSPSRRRAVSLPV